ncbi:hypothetical protein GDO78_020042 [Eleutherodactylus coqui]|uniref:Uncharacterized protein n=1 Tax=Eleutherodactylus coqui TaxID=57060 RepID=A0A8J6JPU5_ELECQ|nr:hypothetical protein GDO78_020042 [Eleutherodactylus coqui]
MHLAATSLFIPFMAKKCKNELKRKNKLSKATQYPNVLITISFCVNWQLHLPLGTSGHDRPLMHQTALSEHHSGPGGVQAPPVSRYVGSFYFQKGLQ